MSKRREALTPTLIVEDDPVLRTVIAGALEDAGFHPVECADLASSRTAIARANPSVVVLDLGLGDEFGDALLEELAASDAAPAVVVCSAFGLASLIAARFSVPCVMKPFDLEVLIDQVHAAIEDNRRPQRQQA
jgi:DNA-binding response OmpR family regulator